MFTKWFNQLRNTATISDLRSTIKALYSKIERQDRVIRDLQKQLDPIRLKADVASLTEQYNAMWELIFTKGIVDHPILNQRFVDVAGLLAKATLHLDAVNEAKTNESV